MAAEKREPTVVVLGGGSWGTTVASICARRGPTLQWVRSEATAKDINDHHRNHRYLGNDVILSDTLRADITARATAKLLAHMASRGYTHAYPQRGNQPMREKPSWDIQANYVKRSLHALPKSGTKRPWNVRQNYLADAIDYRFDRVEEAMVFGRAGDRARLAG